MPLRTTEIDLAAERDALTDQAEAMAEKQADFPMGSDGARQAGEMGQELTRHRAGVVWALEEWDTDSVTVGAMTNGERHLVGELVDADAAGAVAMRQNVYVAVGTRAAPYLAHDPERLTHPEEREAVRETAGNVATIHPAFADWVMAKIQDLGQPDGDMGKSYRELVLAKRRQATSEQENG